MKREKEAQFAIDLIFGIHLHILHLVDMKVADGMLVRSMESLISYVSKLHRAECLPTKPSDAAIRALGGRVDWEERLESGMSLHDALLKDAPEAKYYNPLGTPDLKVVKDEE